VGVSQWTETHSNRAHEIWSAYVRSHDVSNKIGQTAGIDPDSGRIWFGNSILDVVTQCRAEGSDAPLFFVRVGAATYYQKGGRR
jgi:hypothetical protein